MQYYFDTLFPRIPEVARRDILAQVRTHAALNDAFVCALSLRASFTLRSKITSFAIYAPASHTVIVCISRDGNDYDSVLDRHAHCFTSKARSGGGG